MDLIRNCLICNNHYPNPEKEGSGLGEEEGWRLFSLLWKLLGICGEEGENRAYLRGQPWCGECRAVLDDLRRLQEEIEAAQRRQETILDGVKFLVVSDNRRSECLEEGWAAHRLQLVKHCAAEMDGIPEEDGEEHPMSFEEDAILPDLPEVEQKADIRDCSIVLKRLLPEEYEKKVAVLDGPVEDVRPAVRKSSRPRRKPSKLVSSDIFEGEIDRSDPDFEPEMPDSHNLEVKVEVEEAKLEVGDNPIHKCRKCKKRFSDKATIRAHYRQAHNDKQFRCEICGMGFNWKQALERHVARHANRPTSWTCKDCGLIFSKRHKLNTHAIQHNTLRQFKCELCGKGFKCRAYVTVHKRIVHKQWKRKYPKSASSVPQVKVRSAGVVEQVVKTGAQPKTREILVKCQKCPMTFKDKPSRRAHHLVAHNNDLFQCEICGKGYKWRYDLVRHVAHHANPPKKRKNAKTTWICEHCGMKFTSQWEMKKHGVKHSDLRPFKCDFCDKTYKDRTGKYFHERRIHKEELEGTFIGPKLAFPCEYCDKIYLLKSDLEKHKRISHWRLLFLNEDGSFRDGVEIFKCPKDDCDYKHPLKDLVHSHFSNVHKHEGSLPYVCQYCGKGFKYLQGKKEHELIHVNKDSRPFVCEICGKAYSVPTALYSHKRLKHGGRRLPSFVKKEAGGTKKN